MDKTTYPNEARRSYNDKHELVGRQFLFFSSPNRSTLVREYHFVRHEWLVSLEQKMTVFFRDFSISITLHRIYWADLLATSALSSRTVTDTVSHFCTSLFLSLVSAFRSLNQTLWDCSINYLYERHPHSGRIEVSCPHLEPLQLFHLVISFQCDPHVNRHAWREFVSFHSHIYLAFLVVKEWLDVPRTRPSLV